LSSVMTADESEFANSQGGEGRATASRQKIDSESKELRTRSSARWTTGCVLVKDEGKIPPVSFDLADR